MNYKTGRMEINVRVEINNGTFVFNGEYLQDRPLASALPNDLFAYDIVYDPKLNEPVYIVKAAYRNRYGTIITNKRLNFRDSNKIGISSMIFYDQEKDKDEFLNGVSEEPAESVMDCFESHSENNNRFPDSILREIMPELFV